MSVMSLRSLDVERRHRRASGRPAHRADGMKRACGGRWPPAAPGHLIGAMRAARAGAIVEHMASADVSTEEFRALFRAVRRWGGDDARGALRHLTPERW